MAQQQRAERFKLAGGVTPDKKEKGRVENDARVLSWEEAAGIPVIADAARGTHRGNYPIFTRAKGSFRWVFHFSAEHMSIPLVDGDVSSVYPGISNDAMRADLHCLAKFFPDGMMNELAAYMRNALQGVFEPKVSYTWHSYPEWGFSVQVTFHKSYRFLDHAGRLCCVQIGETTDVTAAMREHEALVAGVIARSRDAVDHRFGNKLRLMHLLCTDALDERSDTTDVPTPSRQRRRSDDPGQTLLRCFESLSYEVAIRRGHFDNLPPVDQVDAVDFIKGEFVGVDVDISFRFPQPERPRLLFFNRDLKPLSPIVLQVLILQDIASNAFKHGTGRVEVDVTPTNLVFRNDKRPACVSPEASSSSEASSPSSSASSTDATASKQEGASFDAVWRRRRVGLRTLRTLSGELDLGIAFDDDGDSFVTTVTFGEIRAVALAAAREEEPSSNDGGDDEGSPSSSPERTAAQEYAWVFMEDEAVIATMFQKLMHRKHGVDVLLVTQPCDVGNLARVVVHAHRTRRRAKDDHRGTIFIMDENVVEMAEDCSVVPVTGTALRDRLFAHPATRALIDAKELCLFSASASEVHDPRCLLCLGKTGSVAKDAARILDAVRKHHASS
mmetsp:Transcript_4580/g.14337  ORF Transcript_4580/g.14337 Transcript_4580/m.14337 type:complete len:613 (+) Transcript_4580:27-1865(+)